MNLTPPTDNLYKFLAIFGLVLVGYGLYLPLQKADALSAIDESAESSYSHLFTELNKSDDMARLQLQCAIAISKVRDKQPPDATPCRELEKQSATGLLAKANAEKINAQLLDLRIRRKFLYKQMLIYWVLAGASLIVGITCSILGFMLWYVRVQKFEDARIKAESSPSRTAPRKR